MEISLENLYVDLGTSRAKLNKNQTPPYNLAYLHISAY